MSMKQKGVRPAEANSIVYCGRRTFKIKLTLTHSVYSLNRGAHILSLLLPLRNWVENQTLKQASYSCLSSLQFAPTLFIFDLEQTRLKIK